MHCKLQTESPGNLTAKTILKNKVRRHTLPDLKASHKNTVLRIVQRRDRNWCTDQQGTVQSPEKKKQNPCIYGQLMFYKRAKTIQWGARQSFQQNRAENVGSLHADEWGWTLTQNNITSGFRKINSNWVKDGNVRPNTIKFLEENTRQSFTTRVWQWFLGCDQSIGQKRKKKRKLDIMKIKEFCSPKDSIHRIGEGQGLISSMYREFVRIHNNDKNQATWAKGLEQILLQRRWTSDHYLQEKMLNITDL